MRIEKSEIENLVESWKVIKKKSVAAETDFPRIYTI